MTNKQERYFVVSESELLRALSAAEHVGTGPAEIRKTLLEMRDLAEAACRARPVERPHYGEKSILWVEVEK